MFRHVYKSVLAGVLSTVMALSLAGCGNDELNYLDKDGKIPSYTISDAPDGTYILKKEDKRAYVGLKVGGINTEDDTFSTIHYWLLEDMEKAIPELTVDDQIIVKSLNERPSSYTFVKMVDYGYTVGTNFDILEGTGDLKSPTIITFGADVNPASPADEYLTSKITTGHYSNENVKITAINGKEFTQSMLTEQGYLKGLTKQGMYDFTYYEGTQYKSIMIKADSHLFVAADVYKSTSYAEMEDEYFVVAPSREMDNGYYYLKGCGLFHYTGAQRFIGDPSEKEIDTAQSEEQEASISKEETE